MILEIISPDKLFYKGESTKVTVPGLTGRFTMLKGHAPIISMLGKGQIVFEVDGKDQEIGIVSGLVEAKNEMITVCIDQLAETTQEKTEY